MTYKKNNRLIWIDLEMTGLNVSRDRIIEIAIIITDADLNIIAESKSIAIHQTPEIMSLMDGWNVKTHGESGLVERVSNSTINEMEAEEIMLNFLKQYTTSQSSPMCGNSVYQDRRFLERYMPELERYFHYRLIDVSTLKELCSRWAPHLMHGFSKQSKHLALEDIKDSIDELKYYRKYFISTAN